MQTLLKWFLNAIFLCVITVDLVQNHFHRADVVTHHRTYTGALILGLDLDLAAIPDQTIKAFFWTVYIWLTKTLPSLSLTRCKRKSETHSYSSDLNVFRYVLNGDKNKH